MADQLAGRVLSVSEAAARGVAGLARDAEEGSEILLQRHGRAVAMVVGAERLAALRQLNDDLVSACLVLTRAATDTGERTDLDGVIRHLGFDRAELEAELAGEDDPS